MSRTVPVGLRELLLEAQPVVEQLYEQSGATLLDRLRGNQYYDAETIGRTLGRETMTERDFFVLQSFATTYGFQLKLREEALYNVQADYRRTRENPWSGWYWQIPLAALLGAGLGGRFDQPLYGVGIGAAVGLAIKFVQAEKHRRFRSRLTKPEHEALNEVNTLYRAKKQQIVGEYLARREKEEQRRSELLPLAELVSERT